ncbi:hypothetical protein L7F22_040005 [Adiantum nelumboides]|nr:hypothetical protein [Adiantum nelumboides]
MASGRKNRGSRHRSHRHKQQKGDDSGDSDAEQNLRHGPNPNPNPSSSSPWTMEPLPPNVEGPSVLKQPDTDNVDRDSQQSSVVKRRKESITVMGDTASVMDRWDGGGGADEAATLALLGVAERSSDGMLSRKESRGESEPRNSKGKSRATSAVSNSKGVEPADSNPIDSSAQNSVFADLSKEFKSEVFVDTNLTDFAGAHISAFDGSDLGKGRASKSLAREKEFENATFSANVLSDVDKKRARKSELWQKAKKLEGSGESVNESREEYHGIIEKGSTGLVQDVIRNIELEKELESRIRRRTEGSGDRDKWRDGGKERDLKGSRFYNEEHYSSEVRSKDEKSRQERLKDDAAVKSRRERSSSRHRDDNWKPGRHLEDKTKEEDQNVSGGREGWAKYEKDHEQKRKSDKTRVDRSSEVKGKDEKQEEFLGSKDDTKNGKGKDLSKDTKEKEPRATEGKHKESRSKDSRHRDDKDRECRSKTEGTVAEDKRLTGETVKKDIFNQQKEERHTVNLHQDEVKREFDKPKEDKLRIKGKLEENFKDDREKLDKHREEGAAHMKYKHDRRRAEAEQEEIARHREDLGFDAAADCRVRKRNERELDFGMRYNKRQSDEGGFDRRQDERDTNERQRIDIHPQRENQQVNGKQMENSLKYEKMYDLNDRDRDTWSSGERAGREKVKDDMSRHSKRRDESQERRWGGGMQDERFKNNKETYDRQKHSREMDERQRFGLFNVSKQRGERGNDERKQIDKLKEDRHEEAPIPVFERLGTSKEINRRSDGGDKESRRLSLDKSYDQFGKRNKDFDGQLKSKGLRDPMDARESKGHAPIKGDRTAAKTSRSTSSQDQERVLSLTGAKDASTSDNHSKRTLDSDMFDAPTITDRDFARPRGRQVEDMLHGDRALHEKSGRKNKFDTSLSSSSGTRRPRDQNWHVMNHGDPGRTFPGPDEEVRSWEPKVPNQDSDDERRRPYSHERIRDTSSPRGPVGRGHDDFGRGPGKHRRLDDTAAERPDWSHQGTQGNRVSIDGPMGRPLPPNRHLGSSALLPPPPPYRPGVDNPTVMGAPSNFVEASNARDGGRYDRKAGGGHSRRSEMIGPGDTWGGFGMSSWNTHNQGPVPGPGGLFPSFPQMAPGFLGMGQQFHVPQVFGPNGSRPVNMGFGGRFRMGDGGNGFPAHASDHGPGMGWHRFSDGTEGHRPLSGFMHAWEGSGRYPDERQRFAHPDWDQFSQGIGGGWEGVSETWQGQGGDAGYDVNSTHRQREDVYQGRIGDVSWIDSETEKVQPVENSTLETPEMSHVCTKNVVEKFVSKASKQFKERLQKLLLHANVQANLVDADLYKEYLSYLPPSKAKKSEAGVKDQVDNSTGFIDQDLEFEVDSEAQDLLSSATPCPTILPPLPHNAFEDALKVFQRPQDRIQKSKFGSFVLPKSISVMVRPSLNTETAKMDVEMNVQEQQCTLPGPSGETVLETAAAKELVDARLLKSELPFNAAESFTELDGTRVVSDGGISRVPVLPDKTDGQTQEGYDPVLRSIDDTTDHKQGSVDNGQESNSGNCLVAPEIAYSSDWVNQNEVSFSSDPEAPPLVEREQLNWQVLESMPLNMQASTFSSKEKEELRETVEKLDAIIVDGQKDKHRQEIYLESTLASLP